jgi:hypothetical protein
MINRARMRRFADLVFDVLLPFPATATKVVTIKHLVYRPCPHVKPAA